MVIHTESVIEKTNKIMIFYSLHRCINLQEVMIIKHGKATIYIHGTVDREKIKEATIIFMTNVMRSKKNGNDNKTGNIKEKQILDK